ncbi:MAG: P63C domain-containing protein [Sterolibacterium sp.]|nr:P63C domain-containing protein [Sterolibacterium sp.]
MKTEVKGRAKGGVAAAKTMTPVQLKARAQKGALARWGKPVTATHKGNFKDQLGLDVECYVLNDISKTPVISQTGMARALGMSSRGSVFPKFLNSKAMAESVSAELSAKLQKPIVFQWGSGGTEQPPSAINGYDAALLIDVCNAIASAHSSGHLTSKRYDKVIKQASIITGASAKSGIRNLVYAMAGYNPSAQQVIDAFKAYVLEEAKKYEKEFPTELYAEWQRLYNITPPQRGKNWKEMHLTIDHIYYPLAKSNGKLLELVRSAKTSGGDRNKKLFQFLNEIGARALRMQLGRVLEMAESSPNKETYEGKIVERFGGQLTLDLPPTYPIA